MSRGWKYPESATVYVDAGSICDVPCRKQFCAEIPKTSGCFEDPKAGENSQRQPDVEDGGITKEEPSLNHGTIPAGLAAGGNDAIDIPGVPIGSSTEGDTDVGDIGESDFVVGLVAGGAAV
jgi:hypothetical protein